MGHRLGQRDGATAQNNQSSGWGTGWGNGMGQLEKKNRFHFWVHSWGSCTFWWPTRYDKDEDHHGGHGDEAAHSHGQGHGGGHGDDEADDAGDVVD